MVNVLCRKFSLIKALQLVLTGSCLGLHLFSLKPTDSDHFTLLSMTFLTFFIIESGVIFGALSGTPVPSHVDALYSVVGSALFLASGIASLRFWDDEPRELQVVHFGMWKGVLSCMTSVIFLVDAFLGLRGEDVCAGQPYSD